ncbi:MAG: glycosyltransferase family 39 protein, partial [Candidatus Eisenbacteria bacterium]|nr:glycosyltransferase family 39 protein [Candidatus Eisenbacteria bacterium]
MVIVRRTANHLAECAGASALLLLTTVLTCYRIAEPAWEAGNQGYLLCQHTINARNLDRFGPLRCGPCLVNCYGDRAEDAPIRQECGVRTDNPPLMHLMMAGVYRLFGESETASRLPATASSVALVMLLYVAGRSMVSPAFGLAAGLCLAVVPIRAHYGRLADGTILSVFFSVAALLAYLRFVTTGARRWVFALVGSFLAAVSSGWCGHFIGPSIFLHAALRRPTPRGLLRAGLLAAAATTGGFLLHVAWAFSCGGPRQLAFLFDKFLERTAFGDTPQEVFTLPELLLTLLGRSDRCMSPALSLLALTGTLGMAIRLRRRAHGAVDACGLMLMAFWIAPVVVMQNTVVIHDFFMFYPAAPFFALAGAMGLRDLLGRLPRRGVRRPAVAVGVVGFFLVQSAQLLNEYHRFPPEFADDVYVARALRAMTADDEPIFFETRPRFPRFWAYLDRRIEIVESVEHLQRIVIRLPAARYCVLAGGGAGPPDLRAHLFAHHHATQIGSYTVFDLTAAGASAIMPSPPVTGPPAGDSSTCVRLVGVETEPDTIVFPPPPSGAEWYVNAHPELTDERMRRLSVTCGWEVPEVPTERFRTRIRLIQTCTGTTQAAFTGEPWSGNLPTTAWPAGGTVREHLDLLLPEKLPSGSYRVEASLLGSGEAPVMNAGDPSATVCVTRRERHEPLDRVPACQAGHVFDPSPLELVGWTQRGAELSTFWRLARPCSGCFAARLRFTYGDHEAWWDLGLLPCNEWQTGSVYRHDACPPEEVMPAASLSVAVRGPGPGEEWVAPLGGWGGRPPSKALGQIGRPDGSPEDCARIAVGDTASFSFDLPEQTPVDLVIWWTGSADKARARLKVWTTAEDETRMLAKRVLRADRPGACRVRVPSRAVTPGRLTVRMTLTPIFQPWIGWRQWV